MGTRTWKLRKSDNVVAGFSPRSAQDLSGSVKSNAIVAQQDAASETN